nr:lytic transglycosylase domain-containing protein [Notoacmeibacter sp. MSK16QG-6]
MPQTEGSLSTTVSAERWQRDEEDYVLDDDGKVRLPSVAPPTADQIQPHSQNGNIAVNISAPNMDSDVTDIVHIDIHRDDHNGSLSASEGAANPECGPSPLSPEQIKQLVIETANRRGVDPLFATAIAWAESDFDRLRNSNKGARGPMQLIPSTAERFGVSDVCDPAANIEGGVAYLRVLLDEFTNPLLVAAAYNAGEHRIYEYGGIPPFKETVSYLAKVLNYQLGLPAKPGRRDGKGMTPTKEKPIAGVLSVEKPGVFVGGVMKF